MYSMKETCEKLNISYETLKYYCNEGLIPDEEWENKERSRLVLFFLYWFYNCSIHASNSLFDISILSLSPLLAENSKSNLPLIFPFTSVS